MVLVLHIHGHCQVVGHKVDYHAREEEVHLTDRYKDTQKTADGTVHPPYTSYDEIRPPTERYIWCPISCSKHTILMPNIHIVHAYHPPPPHHIPLPPAS